MEPPATNGAGGDVNNVSGAPLTEEEMLERQRMRPADVDADMREMMRRKRVDAILNSKTFRSELDRLVESGVIDGSSVGGCLQQISDMMGLTRAGSAARGPAVPAQCVQPIADLRGAEASQFTKPEKQLRCQLAALFRALDQHSWAAGARGHATARISGEQDQLLVNPQGLLYGEVTASTLVKTDSAGRIVHPGCTGLGLPGTSGGAELARHAAVLSGRPELSCVLTVRAPAVVAVSALRAGLLPLAADAAVLGPIVRHVPGGTAAEDGRRLAEALQQTPTARVILLQNGGALCCGETVPELLYLLTKLVAACENQVRMLPLGVDNLLLLDEAQQREAYEAARCPPPPVSADSDVSDAPWRLGELEFEALMRQMDLAGYRTGHVYRNSGCATPTPPAQQQQQQQQLGEMDHLPTAAGYSLDTDDIFKYSPMRKMQAGHRAGERTRWLNTPNVYQRLEVTETGGGESKTVTKVSTVKGVE